MQVNEALPENKILLISVLNALHPITVDVLHKVSPPQSSQKFPDKRFYLPTLGISALQKTNLHLQEILTYHYDRCAALLAMWRRLSSLTRDPLCRCEVLIDTDMIFLELLSTLSTLYTQHTRCSSLS